MKIFKRIYRRLVKTVRFSITIPLSIGFALRNRRLRSVRKIIYVVTPPSYLPNIGDHAQVISIRRWMEKHFPSLPVIELDMDQCKWYLPAVRWLIRPGDLIFFHSGGNLGDRGIWCESRRRLYIRSFPDYKIISLPQTIYFSDTPGGRKEREKTRRIYSTHPDLTIIARDPQSGLIANDLFPRATTFSIPDFVLSLPPRQASPPNTPRKILLCLRIDIEGALSQKERTHISSIIPYPTTYFDTTFDHPIKIKNREQLLERTLNFFSSFDAVITDRYHGLIFAVLCQKPCLALPTVHHKLSSSAEWFIDLPYVTLIRDLAEIPAELERCVNNDQINILDWNQLYFDALPERLGIQINPQILKE